MLAQPTSAQEEDATKWVDQRGREIQAEFVRLTDDGVILRLTTTGREAEVPFASLSLESHFKAIKLGKPEEFSKPMVRAETEADRIAAIPSNQVDVDLIMRSPFSESQDAQQFLSTLKSEVEGGNYFAVWHAIPPKMQDDLSALVAKAAAKIEMEGILVQIKSILNSLDTLVNEKADFIMNHPAIAANPMMKEQLEMSLPIYQKLIPALANEEIWQKENLSAQNIPRFIALLCAANGSVHDMNTAVMEKQIGSSSLWDYKVIRSSSKSAEVEMRVTLPLPQPLPPRQFVMAKLNDIWIVPSLMNPFREAVDKASTELDSFDGTQASAGIKTALALATPVIGSLSRANTQEEFNQAVDSLMSAVQAFAQNNPEFSAGFQAGFQGGPPGGGFPGGE